MIDDYCLPVIANCNNCGACCQEIGTPPFLRSEIYELPEDLRDEVLAFEKSEPNREKSGKPCFWFDGDSKRCSHYEDRPMVCRDFEVGTDSCLSYRRYHRIDAD